MKRRDIPKYLFENMNIVEPYPMGVAKVDKQCNFTAFFPGGKGLWDSICSEKIPYIMVIGHDFSTEKKFNEMIDHKSNDVDSPTWRNMIKLFNEASIDLETCFFTNVFMGLRQTESMVGRFPGFKDKAFVARNIEFLNLQIDYIKPLIIITLGKNAAELLTHASDDLELWKNNSALKKANVGLVRNVRFNMHQCSCVALEHPSMRNSNVKRRVYKGHVGNEAEVLMIKESLSLKDDI